MKLLNLMLSTQILVQSYYLDAFSFLLSVKSHVTTVKYTDLVQSYTWTHFQFNFSLNLMFSMLSTQILVQYYNWTHFQFTFLLNLMSHRFSSILTWTHFQIVKSHCSILYLDTFSVHFSVKSHVYHVKYTDFI